MQRYLFLVAIAIIATNANASCGSAYCSANTLWDTQGLAGDEGLRVDLRYSYAKADKWRAGLSKIIPEAPSGSGTEIENKRTVNQLLNLDADYTINSSWNIALGVPLVLRDHSHTFDPLAPDTPFTQQAKFTELGDIRWSGNIGSIWAA